MSDVPVTAAMVRDASHMVAHFSKLLSREAPPSRREWEHLRGLFSREDTFAVSEMMIVSAIKMEAREAGNADLSD
ncbi:MAG TPA: hypothetical protein VNQ99_17755 [Xanthobacteraceae bacterium]|nr:hypothetical protein [Xanthobacteraceae bacterium]